METVGMVGVGAMGSALLERLRLADVSATVYDVAPAALERARAQGATCVGSAAAVARAATLVDVVVRTDQEVQDAVLGPDGVLAGAAPGTLVLLHSTILPQTTRAVAEAARPRGVEVIDACMVGVPRVVRAGNLSFVVGGPPELFERARPHLLRMGKQALHVGPLGAGNAAKLIKNLVTGAEALVIHEALLIGEAAGIPYRDALAMMRQVSTGSVLDRWDTAFDASGAGPTPLGSANLYDKDIPLAATLGREYGLDLPITEQLHAAGARLPTRHE
jgi:3-hydroxyisobutyrate dehydrogenase-like beta-hydroxyacid dehydrogenase